MASTCTAPLRIFFSATGAYIEVLHLNHFLDFLRLDCFMQVSSFNLSPSAEPRKGFDYHVQAAPNGGYETKSEQRLNGIVIFRHVILHCDCNIQLYS